MSPSQEVGKEVSRLIEQAQKDGEKMERMQTERLLREKEKEMEKLMSEEDDMEWELVSGGKVGPAQSV